MRERGERVDAAPARPPLAVTMGDAAGIGPEIVAKALACPELEPRPVVLGDAAWLERTVRALALEVAVRRLGAIEEASGAGGLIEVLDVAPVPSDLRLGVVDARAGAAAAACIREGVRLACEGRCGGLVTAPIHKEALAAAGVPFPGHTEMLAHHAGVDEVAMMLANDALRVVLVSIHVALADAVRGIDRAGQLRAIRFADMGARALGVGRPRIAVAGLNPHAGDGGLFGREEIEVIAPAVAAARDQGFDVSGPWPGDAVFRQAREGRFDVVVAQYHDQALIPIKYLGIADGVNFTLGLPFIRTSPDHGTAFDIAASRCAEASGMLAAIVAASRFSR